MAWLNSVVARSRPGIKFRVLDQMARSLSLSGAAYRAAAAETSYRVVVVGGGTGGCAIASKFARYLDKGKVAVIEPSETHYYQPHFTMVAGGLGKFEQAHKPMESILDKNCDWIRDSAAGFDPDSCTVTTGNGKVVKYDFLVVAMGLQLNYHLIEGAVDALKTDPGVCSIYSPKHVTKVKSTIDALKTGNAIFTFPNTPIKCAGAAQKICYIAEDLIKKRGIRKDVNFMYNTATPGIFSVPYYAEALANLAASRGIKWNKLRDLAEIRPASKEAVFNIMDNGQSTGNTEIFKYSMLHIAPPMSTPKQLWNSPLVDSSNFVTVDKESLQHVKYKNVFALGDCSNVPTSKTAAACTAQIAVVSQNLRQAMKGVDPSRKYSGYSSCPVITNTDRLMLIEFGYDGKPMETFPFDQRIPRRSMYLMNTYPIPIIYWNLLIRGYWHGPAFIRKLLRLGLSDNQLKMLKSVTSPSS